MRVRLGDLRRWTTGRSRSRPCRLRLAIQRSRRSRAAAWMPIFTTYDYREARARGAPFWLRLDPQSVVEIPADAALAVRKGRHLAVRAYDSGAHAGQELMRVAMFPEYRAEQTALYRAARVEAVARCDLPARRSRRCRRRKAELLTAASGEGHRLGSGPGALDCARLRCTHGNGGGGAPDPLRHAGTNLHLLRDAVLAAGALHRLHLRPGFRMAGLARGAAARFARLERAGGALGGGGLPVRARNHRHATLLSAQLPCLRLALGCIRRARALEFCAQLRAWARPWRRPAT